MNRWFDSGRRRFATLLAGSAGLSAIGILLGSRRAAAQAGAKPVRTNQEIARRFFDDVFNRGQLEVVDQIFAPEYVGYSSASFNGPIKGPEGIKQFVTMYRKAFPDINFKFEDVLTDGDKVIVRWTTTGTHRGALQKFGATGKTINIAGIGIAQIANGRIRVSHSQVDVLGIVEQIGAVPRIRQ
jgi:steroid delta-isomerase-like uncharacterized protein